MPVIDTNGLRVDYNDTGDGMPVVFVPGVAGSGEWFRYQASGLSDQFRVITYDLRRTRGGAFTLDLLVDDLAQFLLALKVYYAAVVGHSLGGLIALKYALDYPGRCPALVLCSTAPCFPDLPDSELVSHLLPQGVSMPSFWGRVWSRLAGSRQVSDQDEPCAFLARSVSKVDPVTLHDRLRLLRETDVTGLLGGVEVPTLVMASSGDMPYVLSGSQVLQQGIPDATLEVTEGTDRFYFCTRHDLFNSVLAEWLAESSSRF